MEKFCKYCGSELDRDVNFCPSCGKQVNGKNCSDPQPTKSLLIENLQECIRIFSAKQQTYDLRNQAQLEIQQNIKGGNILIVIICVVAGLFIANMMDHILLDCSFWNGGIQVLGFVVFFALIGIALPILIVGKRNKGLAQSKKNLAIYSSELIDYYNSQKIPLEVSFEYSDPRVLIVLLELLKSGRADTYKEAINCMLDDIHKEKMLNSQNQTDHSERALSLLVLALLLNLDE